MSETTDTSTGTGSTTGSGNSLGFPLKGTLRRSPFPKLVRQLARTKSTGSLYLLNGKTKKVVFFERGEPISVRSNVTTECLGQILAREGLITQAQCDQTLESIRRTGKKQGELLIEMGILSEGNLRYGLEAQLRHKLFDIFAWDDGRYQYKPDIKGDDYGLRFNTHAQGLILNALLETTEESRAKDALDPYADRFPVIDKSHGAPDLDVASRGLTPEEDYFLACLDGSQSIEELLETPADPIVPSAALLLYASIQAGVAKLAKSRRQPRERPDKPEDGRVKPDRDLDPGYTPRLTVTTYEDTPLPGELPKPPTEALEDDFDAPELGPANREISSVLVAAERDTPDETFDEDLDLGDADDEAGADDFDDGLNDHRHGTALVADPAESGVFERVLLDDDDDDQPFGANDDGGEPALVDDPDEPDEVDEPDEIEELEEIEEIEELEEIESDDAYAPHELAPDNTPDSGVPSYAPRPAPAPSSAREDELAALAADLEVDDDLALDGSLGAALDVLDNELPLDDTSLDPSVEPGLNGAIADPLAADDELAAAAADLLGLDDLDDIDLGLDDDHDDADDDDHGEHADDSADANDDYDPDATAEADAETLGALHFSDGESALAEGRWAQAISHFEAAYQRGIDVAELHTMLAWGRFQVSGESPEMADHALELLAYAEEMNPNLAMVHAYRSALLLALGDNAGAQDASQRALDIDPYDELAIDVMDKLV